MDSKKHNSLFSETVKSVMLAVTLAVTLIPAIYGVIAWVDNRIETTVTKQDFLARIAAQIRPSAIFDGKCSILADMGAMRMIDKISIEKSTNSFEIIVCPKKYLSIAPLVTCLDKSNTLTSLKRGKMFSWEYVFTFGTYLAAKENNSTRLELACGISDSDRYRIELLQPIEP